MNQSKVQASNAGRSPSATSEIAHYFGKVIRDQAKRRAEQHAGRKPLLLIDRTKVRSTAARKV